ncbi:deoxyribodipyrimidine photo-lyase [Pseudooceanicola nanhaiensis]|uniref:Deoxyribodipyrimidine photo-lyase n=1 Tax=Pseudooceanicola nanhaiensis TaxID=375761 RepID=A0A917SQI4_9RHOB|nr:deoxyribodipyrimidine photo-lyase [Pseudooceanicola nanhaiensis]GGL89746.1 deoxyribodipyrimidine photo-lyase [Pseudooceanicola nanhaiensis]
MSGKSPCIMWFRRDLRLADHPALRAAAEGGRPVVPVFIRDAVVDDMGAAPRWRLERGLEVFAEALETAGSRLVLRAGPALEVLRELVEETGADTIYWSRLYEPAARERDERVKAGLRDDGLEARSFPGHLLFEPWTVETGQGGYYKVFTPYWKAVKGRDLPAPCPKPDLTAPDRWPRSDRLADWSLGGAMNRGAAVVAEHVDAGEAAANRRFGQFVARRIDDYAGARDMLAEDGTSGMSQYLTLGEISPLTLWTRSLDASGEGAETFRKELAWREFSHHLVFHTPHITEENWREEWRDFPWNDDDRRKEVIAWKRGRTGEPVVDAAMRELFVTGRMHNRARMIVASYLCKHLLCHWRIGQKWFEECLVDWDPASNALGWQWVAGSGPDAAPYFRVFNPETQAERFDPDRAYRRRWLAEGEAQPTRTALSYFDAIPRSWRMDPGDPDPDRIVGLKEGRDRALAAYEEARS